MLHAVIMAGGSGTRFWPASRAGLPKQFLKLGGTRTLIQATLDRILGLVPLEQVQIVTNQQLVPLVHDQLPELPASAILGEPCKRDTAPCVALAAGLAVRRDPAAIQVVMPSDHVIQTPQDFQLGLRFAHQLVTEHPEQIVTFGIRPTYPATAFGYIQKDPDRRVAVSNAGEDFSGRIQASMVQRFREKPTLAVAEELVASGQCLWNAGIFVWRAETILRALRQFAPEIMEPIDRIVAAADGPNFAAVLQEQFPLIPGRSIDYAVMEQYPAVTVVEAPFAWDDVGNWNSLARLVAADEAGNHVAGQHLGIESQNCVIQTEPEHLVVTVGVDDLIVVQTPDATLIADRSKEELIRQCVPALQASGRQGLV